MSDDTDDQEKTEPATPRRLEKAREEGQVARSRELVTFLMLGGGLLGLWILGGHMSRRFGMVMEQALLFDRRQAFDTHAMLGRVFNLGSSAIMTLAPLLLALTVIALVAPLMLGGWSMSAKSLAPRFSKLNPAKGLKRMLSGQMFAELGKAIAKSLLVGGIGVWFLSRQRGALVALMGESVNEGLQHAMKLAAGAAGLMVLALVAVVLIDVPYQLWSHGKKLRMTREEVRRENKESEGDPQIRGRIRQRQQAMARGRMMSRVPEADVIVTNPTHYAVALRYAESRMSAPRVVAKGAGPIALRIREIGEEHRVPMLEAPPLARALYRHVDLDREVPGVLYNAVAEVLVWAMRLKRARAEGAAPPPRPADLDVPVGMDRIDEAGEDAT